MVKRWVVNASPIIELCDEVVIPQGVADEINLGGYADSAVTFPIPFSVH